MDSSPRGGLMVKKMYKNGKEKKGRENIRYALPVKRPLGRILIDGDFIKPENLDAALAEQKRTGNLLGEILVDLGVLHKAERDAVLMVQRDFSTVEDAIRAAAGTRLMLGELLLASCHITQDQLDKALDEQKKTGEKLGEVLVHLGFLNQREIDITLCFQSRQGNGNIPSCLSLGELLISAGYITHDHLKDALARQPGSDKKLGEVLVDAGHCKQHHVDHGLRIQKQLVAAALIAALSLAPIEEAMAAQTSSHALSTQIQVTATVLARASLHILKQPTEIIVTDADIQRGFLDVNAASVVEIRNNSRAGVNVIFQTWGLPFKEALVSGFGREVSLGPNGGIVTNQITGTNVVAFSYRFVFNEYSQAGTYAWPISLSVSPVE
jgi:hypothetical protein